MITETFFAGNYPSVWRSIAPTMETFVRRSNIQGFDRVWRPLLSNIDSNRRGLVNEAAFLLFQAAIDKERGDNPQFDPSDIKSAFSAADRYINGLRANGDTSLFSKEEELESAELMRRLKFFFNKYHVSVIQVSPRFAGCGLIQNSTGDVLVQNSKLFEVKAGERAFRSTDYRQIAVYMALHYASTKQVLTSLHLLNPRTGLHFEIDSDTFSREVSGLGSIQFLQNIIDKLSSNIGSI